MKRKQPVFEMKKPFLDMTYWDFCIQTVPDFFYTFSDGAIDFDFEKLNEKRIKIFPQTYQDKISNEYNSLEMVFLILQSVVSVGNTDYILRLEDAELEWLKAHRLVLDDEPHKFYSSYRRPYYRMRGKTITEEQAIEVIRKTDTYMYSILPSRHADEWVGSGHFTNWWFETCRLSLPYGWVHPNGIVGINDTTGKWPTFLEFLEELLDYQRAFPFLDFVVGISTWDEIPQWTYDLDRDDAQRTEFLRQYPDFLDSIEFGMQLIGNTIRFLSQDNTIKKYQEYEKLYANPDFSIYIPELCGSKTGFLDRDKYLQQCLAAFD